MRLLIAAGGTGGHVYPALAVAERLLHITTDSTIAFVGTVGGFERLLLEKSDVPLESIDEVQAGPLHGVNPLKVVTSIFKTLAGIVQSWRILGLRKPNVVLMTGGWVGLPVAVAAWLRRVPIVIFLPDIEPALSIKILRPFAKTIAVTTEASAQYVPESKMIVTGYPLRQSVAGAQRRQAVEHFGLDTAKKTLLVFGGSRGARSINIGLIDALPDLLAKGDLQIIHVTGELGRPTRRGGARHAGVSSIRVSTRRHGAGDGSSRSVRMPQRGEHVGRTPVFWAACAARAVSACVALSESQRRLPRAARRGANPAR
ncbi:MAG: UDP-N-acetylglucosamine--N-acetylmuramyl-(pentapeptide) pyrophosphoryl-undecaprenol N-acetylglucosamine transferase [Chloroflexi bacterium]|nr:UDP-N-acetylglucosamine--N-acetylmuramyl-(pentapeptide) pyrophosphoryl-undecaprenol N-acetylglucosamine transferase [Chloroflexota bacterium]